MPYVRRIVRRRIVRPRIRSVRRVRLPVSRYRRSAVRRGYRRR